MEGGRGFLYVMESGEQVAQFVFYFVQYFILYVYLRSDDSAG